MRLCFYIGTYLHNIIVFDKLVSGDDVSERQYMTYLLFLIGYTSVNSNSLIYIIVTILI